MAWQKKKVQTDVTEAWLSAAQRPSHVVDLRKVLFRIEWAKSVTYFAVISDGMEGRIE